MRQLLAQREQDVCEMSRRGMTHKQGGSLAAIKLHEIVMPEQEPHAAGSSLIDDELPNTGEWAAPTEADVQEVLFSPPDQEQEEPLSYVFNMKAPDLDARMAEVFESVYILYGTKGLIAFESALNGGTRESAPLAALMPVKVRGEPHYRDEDRTPNRHRLREAYERYTHTLPAKRERAVTAIQAAARRIALERIAASRSQLRAEAQRYMSPDGAPDAQIEHFLEGKQRYPVGRDTLALVDALVTIAQARLALDASIHTQQQVLDDWELANRKLLAKPVADLAAKKGYLSTEDILDEWKKLLRSQAEPENVRRAREQVQNRHAALAELIATIGAQFPVVFRLWDSALPFEMERLLRGAKATKSAEVRNLIITSLALRTALADTLQDCWESTADLHENIVGDPTTVWKYPPLIEMTLQELHVDEAQVAWRAAEERMAEERPSEELATLSDVLGMVAIGAAVTGAAHVAIAAELADLALSAYQLLREGLIYLEQQAAHSAFLNPARSLAVDQSASGLAVNTFFLLLNIGSARSTLKAAKGGR